MGVDRRELEPRGQSTSLRLSHSATVTIGEEEEGISNRHLLVAGSRSSRERTSPKGCGLGRVERHRVAYDGQGMTRFTLAAMKKLYGDRPVFFLFCLLGDTMQTDEKKTSAAPLTLLTARAREFRTDLSGYQIRRHSPSIAYRAKYLGAMERIGNGSSGCLRATALHWSKIRAGGQRGGNRKPRPRRVYEMGGALPLSYSGRERSAEDPNSRCFGLATRATQ